MNFGTLKANVERNLGNRGLGVIIEGWINSCYMDIVTTGKFPEANEFGPIPCPALDGTSTFVTASGVPNYPVPPLSLFPISLRDTTNNIPLRPRSIQWYDRNKATTNSKPSRYTEYGGEYWLDPCPDAVYVIQVRSRKKLSIPVLIADADVPVIGQEWHEAIEIGATYRGARSLGHGDAATWQTDLKDFLARHSKQGEEAEEDYEMGFSVLM